MAAAKRERRLQRALVVHRLCWHGLRDGTQCFNQAVHAVECAQERAERAQSEKRDSDFRPLDALERRGSSTDTAWLSS